MSHSVRPPLVPLFLPHQGCDQRCIYCDQSAITGHSGKKTIAEQIEAGLAGKTGPVEVALYSGNIFGLSLGTLVEIFDVLEDYRSLIGSIRISTKPVPFSKDVIGVLKDRGVRVIELGMPCFTDTILASLNRGYTTDEFYESYRYLNQEGFTLGLQIMVGLPGETPADIRMTLSHLSTLRPSLLRIYPLLVLDGTPLAELYKHGHFLPLGVDDAVERSAQLYLQAIKQGTSVIRMGLSSSDVLQEQILAGPYHASFGFLVKARVFMKAVTKVWTALGEPKFVKIRLNSRDIPHLVGHKRSHIEEFNRLGVQLSWETGSLDQGCFAAECEIGTMESRIIDT